MSEEMQENKTENALGPEIVSRKDFLVYEMIRMSGATNMMMVGKVNELAQVHFRHSLSKAQCINIMRNYTAYSNKWLNRATFQEIRAELADKPDLSDNNLKGIAKGDKKEYEDVAEKQEFQY